MKVLISGSIVLYKNDRGIRKPIESFLNTSLPVKLFLIDNSPTNSVKEHIKDFLVEDRVEYIFNNKNIGYGPAHNIAIRKVLEETKYHLVLNPDVYFDDNVLEKLYLYMEDNQEVGLVIPKVIYPGGNLQHLSKLLPTPSDLIFRRFLPTSFIQKRLYNYEMRFSGYNKKMEVPYISGCFMFMRNSLIHKVGLFDERFFLYLEDTDLSRRFFLNAKNMYFPSAVIYHHHKRGSYKNLRLLFIHIKSAIQYFNKWGWWSDKQREEINNKVIRDHRAVTTRGKTFKVKTA